MRCEVLSSLKWNGVRLAPGTVLDIPDEDVALMPAGTVKKVAPPPAPPKPKEKRTVEEKQKSVTDAQARVAKVTGDAKPEAPAPPAPETPAPATITPPKE